MTTGRLSLVCLVVVALIQSAYPFCVNCKVLKYNCIDRKLHSGDEILVRGKATNLFGVTEIGADESDADDSMTGKVISCETTGSCGSVRRAYKQELNDIREAKRLSNVPMEENYLDFLSGDKSAAKASYSPFKKQYPPKAPPASESSP